MPRGYYEFGGMHADHIPVHRAVFRHLLSNPGPLSESEIIERVVKDNPEVMRKYTGSPNRLDRETSMVHVMKSLLDHGFLEHVSTRDQRIRISPAVVDRVARFVKSRK